MKKDMRWLRKIMNQTCYKSLAYCCNRPCPERDKALKRINLTEKKFKAIKNLFDRILFEVVTFEKDRGRKL